MGEEMNGMSKQVHYQQFENGDWRAIDGAVITETPVSLTVNSEVWLTFMCTPVDLEAMAVGFLFNEGLIQTIDEIAQVRLCASGDNIDVWSNVPLEKPTQWRRTSGCTGGVTSVESTVIERPTLILQNGGVLNPHQVTGLLDDLFNAQDLYRQTGGVHTSCLTDGAAKRIAAEDIGRHNTLDKLAGLYLMGKEEFERHIILTTGRISSEMLQKAYRLRASFVISRTSPSSLSIELAEQYGITLIGYTRRNRFNIYTHPERVLFETERTDVSVENNL